MEKPPFKIDFLDHVAIRVADLEVSAAWYQEVLGLERYDVPEWGAFPIFLLAGTSGVALFPRDREGNLQPPGIRIDHFAFQVGPDAFDAAVAHYQGLGLDFSVQDHIHFRSLYTQDPDGHTVELTALQVPPEQFYR